MTKHGMEILKNSPIVEVTKNEVILKNGNKTNTLIWTCGIQGNQEAKRIWPRNCKSRKNYKQMNICKLLVRENVFVVGDMAYYEEKRVREVPQIVEAAIQTADTVVNNIVASIEDKEMVKFKGKIPWIYGFYWRKILCC